MKAFFYPIQSVGRLQHPPQNRANTDTDKR